MMRTPTFVSQHKGLGPLTTHWFSSANQRKRTLTPSKDLKAIPDNVPDVFGYAPRVARGVVFRLSTEHLFLFYV